MGEVAAQVDDADDGALPPGGLGALRDVGRAGQDLGHRLREVGVEALPGLEAHDEGLRTHVLEPADGDASGHDRPEDLVVVDDAARAHLAERLPGAAVGDLGDDGHLVLGGGRRRG
jgi:hypothetical protein